MEPTTLTTRPALAALLILAGALGACSPGGQAAGGGGDAGATPAKFAGLDGEILKWRGEIIAADPLCKQTSTDKKCQGFDVACKAERTVTADDTAKGVVARVVVSMTWTGFDPKFNQAQNGSRAAEFAKGASGWTRTDHKPVNMNTCGDL
jgi:ABC-type amino acid transport substrate-binding protein